jgi:hypothetical protein
MQRRSQLGRRGELRTRKPYVKPSLMNFGDIRALTKGGPPPKFYGPGDGAMFDQQPVHWAS